MFDEDAPFVWPELAAIVVVLEDEDAREEEELVRWTLLRGMKILDTSSPLIEFRPACAPLPPVHPTLEIGWKFGGVATAVICRSCGEWFPRQECPLFTVAVHGCFLVAHERYSRPGARTVPNDGSTRLQRSNNSSGNLVDDGCLISRTVSNGASGVLRHGGVFYALREVVWMEGVSRRQAW